MFMDEKLQHVSFGRCLCLHGRVHEYIRLHRELRLQYRRATDAPERYVFAELCHTGVGERARPRKHGVHLHPRLLSDYHHP